MKDTSVRNINWCLTVTYRAIEEMAERCENRHVTWQNLFGVMNLLEMVKEEKENQNES